MIDAYCCIFIGNSASWLVKEHIANINIALEFFSVFLFNVFLCFDFFTLGLCNGGVSRGRSCDTWHVTPEMWHLIPDTWRIFPLPFQSVSIRFGVGAFYPHKSLDSLSPVYMLNYGSTDCPCFCVRVASFNNSL